MVSGHHRRLRRSCPMIVLRKEHDHAQTMTKTIVRYFVTLASLCLNTKTFLLTEHWLDLRQYLGFTKAFL